MKKFIFLLTLLAALCIAETTFAYTVQKGDTMTNIAKEHGLTLEELSKANPQITNLDKIYEGQHIQLHKKEQALEQTKEIRSDNTNDLSEKELDLLARIVRAEAQTEPFEGKVAVADVVLNRMESKQFPDTIKEVIYEPGQFEPVANGQIDKPADEESIEAVDAALTDMRDITEDSLFFYNPDIATNRWLDTRQTAVVIGQHVFKH
ncbi:cell wall hydrolase [Halalkalibacter okhensis]|uniref:Sporulation specific N-acetylmuramoyl-L-alanine amidase n=1 Tax=Halalkalibacter okhensis TaxID=333138 RepID=A0A0B0INJ6_9BACI|nr:cell wall hydrolase [Halalkalibacter okhensis]KHF41654.1 sporulation specific N-acetylmuramoyl-L-alanine amidase [Halalkalibacter okhensis]